MILPDEHYMGLALDEALLAFEQDEVPVGAVIVDGKGNVVGRGHNLTRQLTDVTAHAEMIAITAAASTLGGKYLNTCTLYVTVEPCIMCAGAIGWSQMGRVVFGTTDPKRGYMSHYGGISPLHPKTAVTYGVLAEECADLMRRFFDKKR